MGWLIEGIIWIVFTLILAACDTPGWAVLLFFVFAPVVFRAISRIGGAK